MGEAFMFLARSPYMAHNLGTALVPDSSTSTCGMPELKIYEVEIKIESCFKRVTNVNKSQSCSLAWP